MAEKPTTEEAQKLLDWVVSLEPAWKERVAAMQEERGDDPLRLLAILCCWTLESGNHMAVPVLDQLMDGFQAAGSTQDCPQCGQPYQLVYPGQPACGPECAAILRGETPGVRHVTAEIVGDEDDDPEAVLRQLPSTATSFKNRKRGNLG